MARRLILARHASVGEEFAGRYLGATDTPLSPRGVEQAKRLGQWLCGQSIGRCYVSPMLRTRQTAELLPFTQNSELRTLHDLREVHFGHWEGKTFAEVSAADPLAVERWATWQADFAFPGGESISAFLSRVQFAADELAKDPADVVLAVTHGGVIRAMICHLLGLDARNYLLFGVKPAACAVIDVFDGKGVLTGLNLPDGEVQ